MKKIFQLHSTEKIYQLKKKKNLSNFVIKFLEDFLLRNFFIFQLILNLKHLKMEQKENEEENIGATKSLQFRFVLLDF